MTSPVKLFGSFSIISSWFSYPIAALKGDSTTSDELEAAKEFIAYLQTDEAMSVFEKYHFSVNE